MLITITIIHEAAHAVVALLLGYKLKKIYLGIPLNPTIRGKNYTTVLFKKEVRGVEFGVSWLILGGAVDFHDFEQAPAWKMTLIALAGPFSNAALAFGSIWIVAGFAPAMEVTGILIQVVLQGLGMVVTGQVGLAQLSGPVGFIGAMTNVAATYPMGWLVVWNVINVALFVTNLLPIPALDGGQVVMAWAGHFLGEKSKKPIRWITIGALYLLCALMAVVMGKDIVAGLATMIK